MLPIRSLGRTLEYMSSPDGTEASVYAITSARRALSDDQSHRKRAYLIAMGIRVVCFLSAILVPAPLPVRAALAGAAIFLPYFAVILANATRRRVTDVVDAETGSYSVERPQLGN